jgi:hypothetical protein
MGNKMIRISSAIHPTKTREVFVFGIEIKVI